MPPGGAPPEGRIVPGIDGAAGGPDTAGASQEVLNKLEVLLGRLRGLDSPAEHTLVHPEIPTLDQPVTWTSPETSPAALPAARHVPTLTESVELRETRDAEGGRTNEPGARIDAAPMPATPPLPTPPRPDLPSAAAPRLPPDPTTRQELRERVESLLDPTLEDRLCERAMADLDRTLMDVERGFRDELEAWRSDQETRIRDQVRGEIERAVDEVVAALAREHDAGRR
ncbi:MAG: hypothetical protein ACK515_17765 [bacterium]|jgi:hypothetical protein|nr:hypothetical protein [Betaproteobacteria bacterium]